MIPYSKQLVDDGDIEAVIAVLRSDYLTQGRVVEQFENALCSYTGRKYALVFNSATSALFSAYRALYSEGSEVIVPAITFMATASMVIESGMDVKLCDIGFDGNISQETFLNSISPKAKIVAPVDFGGNPVDEAVFKIAKEHGLKTINDASHAIGAKVNGKQCGGVSDISIFSFHAIKPITTGEGGAALTDDEGLYQKMKLLRSHGMVKKRLWNSDAESLGHNFRMPEINAALGLSQLAKLDDFIEKREVIARFYDETFSDFELLSTIPIAAHKRSSRHLYPLLLDRSLWCAKEAIFEELQVGGIGAQVHYKPLHEFTYFKNRFPDLRLSNAEDFYRAEISIPCHQGMSLEDAAFVADNVKKVILKQKGCRS